MLRKKATTTNVLDSWQNNSIDVQSEIWKSIKKKAYCIQTNKYRYKIWRQKIALKKTTYNWECFSRHAADTSLYLVGCHSDGREFDSHSAAAQTTSQTNKHTGKRTDEQADKVSKYCQQSPPLLGKAYQLQRYDFWKQFFNLKCPYWNQSVLQFEHGTMSAAITDTKWGISKPPSK